jgi:hypothetical protein
VIYFILLKIPITKKSTLIWIVIGICVIEIGIGPLRSMFFEIMAIFNRNYQLDNSTGGLWQEIFFILSLGIGWGFCWDGDERYWRYYKAIFLSAILLPIIRINPTLFRVYTYFSIYQIVFVPVMLSRINHRVIKLFGYAGYFVVYIYLFFTQSMVSSMKVIPYAFFWM